MSDWTRTLRAHIATVGDCEEWTGRMRRTLPLCYAPAGFLKLGSRASSAHSVRTVLFKLRHGHLPGPGMVLRMSCCNDRCVAERHTVQMTRAESVAEQGRRGELSTPARRMAGRKARINAGAAKLDMDRARAIRASDEPWQVLAERHGVSRKTIFAVRANKQWAEEAPGASAFSWKERIEIVDPLASYKPTKEETGVSRFGPRVEDRAPLAAPLEWAAPRTKETACQ